MAPWQSTHLSLQQNPGGWADTQNSLALPRAAPRLHPAVRGCSYLDAQRGRRLGGATRCHTPSGPAVLRPCPRESLHGGGGAAP